MYNIDLNYGFTNYYYKLYSDFNFSFIEKSSYNYHYLFWPTRTTLLLHIIVVYWTYTWFVLNWKRVQYGKFTRKMKKIWFKILAMIWMAEILLFLTFFFLAMVVARNPSPYFIDYKNIKNIQLSHVWVFTRMSKLVIVLWLCNIIRIYIRWVDWFKLIFVFFLIGFYFLKLGLHDWYFLTHHIGWCKQSKIFIKGKCDIHYRFILIVFRIVHTYLIALSWFFLIYRSINKKKIRYTLLTANIQNVFYLTLLTYVMQLYLIRDSLYDIFYYFNSKYAYLEYNSIFKSQRIFSIIYILISNFKISMLF